MSGMAKHKRMENRAIKKDADPKDQKIYSRIASKAAQRRAKSLNEALRETVN